MLAYGQNDDYPLLYKTAQGPRISAPVVTHPKLPPKKTRTAASFTSSHFGGSQTRQKLKRIELRKKSLPFKDRFPGFFKLMLARIFRPEERATRLAVSCSSKTKLHLTRISNIPLIRRSSRGSCR